MLHNFWHVAFKIEPEFNCFIRSRSWIYEAMVNLKTHTHNIMDASVMCFFTVTKFGKMSVRVFAPAAIAGIKRFKG